MMRPLNPISYLAACLVCCSLVACAVKTKQPYIKDGKEFGVTRGYVWRPTWWNYYERGVSYAEGEYWQDAIEDLEQAIRLREEDRRRARTYGMHFVDYFPHRELGIIHYRQGRDEQAIRELEQSLFSEESAKAEYFLNKARRLWLERTGADQLPPEIDISWPPAGFLTRDLNVRVKGTVRDDQYASGISVNGRSVPVFLAEKELPFSMELSLSPGSNRVKFVARDLLGKETSREMLIMVDRAGPVVFLDPLRSVDRPGGAHLLVAGEVRDALGLARVTINGTPVAGLSGKSHQFEEFLDLPSHQKTVAIEAEDPAGNVTRAVLLVAKEPIPQKTADLRLAFMDQVVTDVLPLFLAVKAGEAAGEGSPAEKRGPDLSLADLSIHLKDMADELTVYYDNLYVEGSVTGPSPIQSLEINGEQFLDRDGRNIFFSYLADLEEGKNTVRIKAADLEGAQARKQINVQRIIPKIFRLSERMRLSLLPFQPDRGGFERARLVTDDFLVALIRQQRFHMVEREQLQSVLEELRLASSRLVEEKTAVRIGRLLAAEGTLVGTVFETPSAIEVVARLVDTETEEILLVKDAFSEDKSLEGIHNMMEGLSYRFRQGLPLLEGTIMRCERKSCFMDIGGEDGVLPGQKVVFFRQGPEIRHPETQMYLGREWEIVAEGRIREVYQDMSKALPVEKLSVGAIKPSDQVMTK